MQSWLITHQSVWWITIVFGWIGAMRSFVKSRCFSGRFQYNSTFCHQGCYRHQNFTAVRRSITFNFKIGTMHLKIKIIFNYHYYFVHKSRGILRVFFNMQKDNGLSAEIERKNNYWRLQNFYFYKCVPPTDAHALHHGNFSNNFTVMSFITAIYHYLFRTHTHLRPSYKILILLPYYKDRTSGGDGGGTKHFGNWKLRKRILFWMIKAKKASKPHNITFIFQCDTHDK